MSNLPPNPYNNFPGPPQMNANAGPQAFNHNQPLGQVPSSQLPPGYGGIKQDPNSNSPLHAPASGPQNSAIQHVNNYSQSASSSPAFNQPGMMSPVQRAMQSSPMRPPMSTAHNSLPNPLPPQTVPMASGSPRTVPNANPSSTPYPPTYQPQQRQINDNAPPLMPSSQTNQPLMNGPPMSQPNPVGPPLSQYPVSSSAAKPPVSSGFIQGISNPPYGPPGPVNKPPGAPISSQPSVPFATPPLTGPPRNNPLVSASTVSGHTGMQNYSGPPTGQQVGPPRQVAMNGPHMGPPPMPPTSEALLGPPRTATAGVPPSSMGPTAGAAIGPSMSGPPVQTYPGQYKNGPSGQPLSPPGPSTGQMGPPTSYSGPQNPSIGSQVPPMAPQGLPPMGLQMGPPPGPIVPSTAPLKSNMQNRYPAMAPGSYVNHQQQIVQQQNMMKQYPQQYGSQALTQQMGQLSVTKQGFDQLWGHHMVDLMQCKHILPEYPEDPPEIKLGPQFADSPNCSPE